MKNFSKKIISAALSALMLMSASTALTGAATVKIQTKQTCCTGAGCANIKSLLSSCGKSKTCGSKKGAKPNCVNKDCGVKKTDCANGNCGAKKETDEKASVTSSTADNGGYNASFENEVIRLVNEERAKNGLKKLSKDDGAVKAARIRAKEIVKTFSHTRPNGTSCFTAAEEVGASYRTAGENIAYGYSTPEQVVNGWMNSQGHRKNILSSSFNKIGVGCYTSGKVLYWTQFFIG